MESGKISELVDPRLGGKYDADQIYKVVLTASCCVRQSSAWRPSMTEVRSFLILEIFEFQSTDTIFVLSKVRLCTSESFQTLF